MRHWAALVAEQRPQTIRRAARRHTGGARRGRARLEREDARGREGFSAAFQVCLPYRGLFVWHVGSDDIVGDANQVLFVLARELFPATAGTAATRS